MSEPNLEFLHPLHFSDQDSNRSSTSQALHGSFVLNLPHVSRSPEMSRAYQVGDPVRLIDWKAFARNDQLIVREERDEAMANIVVVIDGRDTMLWPDKSIEKETHMPCITKFALASRIALHLVHRHVRMGDRVRLVLFDEKSSENAVSALELRSPSHVLSLFDELERKHFDIMCLRSFMKPDNLFYAKTNLFFWMSDFCSGGLPSEFFPRSQNTIVFHLLSKLESDPSWFRDKTCYFDHEAVERTYLGESLKRKDQYLAKLNLWRANLQKSIESQHGSYVLFTDKSSIRSYVATIDTLVL